MIPAKPPFRKAMFGIATSVAAAAITLAIFAIGDSLAPLFKWLIVATTGVLGFLVALFSVGNAVKSTSLIAVGDDMRAGKDIELSDISISGADNAENVRVGSKARAKRNARIRRIRLLGHGSDK